MCVLFSGKEGTEKEGATFQCAFPVLLGAFREKLVRETLFQTVWYQSLAETGVFREKVVFCTEKFALFRAFPVSPALSFFFLLVLIPLNPFPFVPLCLFLLLLLFSALSPLS